ncbi:glycosyltransferase family 2 protein [Actinotalea solisilvae]|uniref:glycosyltransferase family 2 protein n=1 Tax=Actinotalea solisilvae TaxID=2072922 RepID=UPI0018F1884B|nr:glycosyltransferase family 2 protein [Actinotalea solisilvae]
MPDRPALSVVIPVRDDAPALRRCLAALAAQTLPAHEVVVVDNGSVDDSAAVALAAGARVVPEPEPGIPAAASTGYDAATGDVIVRCDADTVPPRDWLERVAAAFADDPQLDALTGTGTFYDVGPVRAAVVGRLYLTAYYVLMHAAMAHPPLWGSAMALRREAWLRARPLVHRDPELHDDVDLAFALGPHARIRYDRNLRVRVSGRSLVGARQTRRRFARAFATLRLSWARTPPWRRWAERLGGAPTR